MIKNNPTQVITVQPAQLIRAYLQVKPAASPVDVVQCVSGG